MPQEEIPYVPKQFRDFGNFYQNKYIKYVWEYMPRMLDEGITLN